MLLCSPEPHIADSQDVDLLLEKLKRSYRSYKLLGTGSAIVPFGEIAISQKRLGKKKSQIVTISKTGDCR